MNIKKILIGTTTILFIIIFICVLITLKKSKKIDVGKNVNVFFESTPQLEENLKVENNTIEFETTDTIEQSQVKKAPEVKEQQEIQEIKKEFENTYVKYIDEDGLFGETLNVIHFKDFDRKDLDESYTSVYTIEAEVLCFSKRDFYKKKIRKGWCDGSFSAEELRKMTKITKEEYQKYLWSYNRITKELKNIVG